MARVLSSTLLAAQKGSQKTELSKMVLSNNGTTYTYYHRSGSNRIKDWDHTEAADRQAAQVILDNSTKAVSALDLRGFKAILSYGITTGSGDEYSATAPLYVVGQQAHSSQSRGRETGLPISLSLGGLPNLLATHKATVSYTQESDDTNTIKDLIRKIYGDSGVTILACYNSFPSFDVVFDSEDSLIDTFVPADSFSISRGSNREAKVNELLSYTKCVKRYEADGKPHIFVPIVTTSTTWATNTSYSVGDTVVPTVANEVEYKCTTAGTSHASTEPTWANALEVADTIADGTVTWTVGYDYDYRLESTYHTFFNETYRKRVVIDGKVVVSSTEASGDGYSGNASDPNYSNYPTILQTIDTVNLRVTGNAQCTAIATARLSHHQAAAERGSGVVPMNVGAEVHDFVKVKDTRLDEYRVGNIGYIRRTNEGGNPRMEFRFGKLGYGVAQTPVPSGADGGAHTHPEFAILLDAINAILAWINAHAVDNDIHSLDIKDQNGNYVGTLGGLTDLVFLGALAGASNLKLYNSSGTGGVAIKAGGLPSDPADGTLELDATTAVKVKSTATFIIPGE